MPDLPSGKGQLNITGVRKEAIKAFRALCEKEGRKQGRQLEIMLEVYIALKSRAANPRGAQSESKEGLLRVGGLEELGDEAEGARSATTDPKRSSSHHHHK